MQFFQKKSNVIIVSALTVLTILIAARIYFNLQADKERAARISGRQAATVETAVVKRANIIPILKFSGSLEPVWQADISSKVASRIDELLVDEGDYVRAGQVIARLDALELATQVEQAKGSVYESRANLEQTQLELVRNEKLHQYGAVSQQALDTARYKKDMAIGQLSASEGNLNNQQVRLNNTTITAPRDGVITKKYVQAGTFANVSMPIVAIADTNKLLAKISIGEAEIVNIHLGQEAILQLPAYGERQFKGKITRISPVASLPSRNFTAEVTLDNSQDELKAGMFANTFITTVEKPQVVVIPQTAIVMREDQKTVFVVNKENVLEQRLIIAGYSGEGQIEVQKGLEEGETIVVGGQNKVREGIKVKLEAADTKGKQS